MFDAHKATKTSWSYIVGIYAGRMRDGRGAGPATIRMAPMERPAIVHPVSVAPPDSKFRRHNAAADRAKFEAEVAELLAKEKLA